MWSLGCLFVLRPVIALAALLSTLTHAAMDVPDVVQKTFDLAASERFTPDARGEVRGHGYSTLEVRYQSGQVDGVPYVILMKTLQANVGDWHVTCEKDAMTDKVFCRGNRGDLDIDLHGNGRVVVSIGTENFPGSNVAIRIDRGKPISNQKSPRGNPWFSAAESKAIVAKLRTANTVTTRYKKWPYESYVDDTWGVQGFQGMYQYLQWAAKRVNDAR